MPGAQAELLLREDGAIELRPPEVPRANQYWFWTREWQEGEMEVDGHIARGEARTFESMEALMEYLQEEVETDVS
jgi:hypothetical protein